MRGKRLTYEFVKEQFEKEGYKLLSKEYINSKTKLKYRCPKGHEHSIIWNNWQQNKKCPVCSRKKEDAKKRMSLKFIVSEFAKDGYKFLTEEYKNNTQKLDYICSKGHRHSTTWGNWQQGARCPYCTNVGRPSIGFIKFEFEKEGYVLLTKEYKNQYRKLFYICPKGHRHSISWNSWKQGNRCLYCSKRPPINMNFIKSEFAKEGYKLLTIKYINVYQKLEYICPNGHRHNISWNNWNNVNNRCPYCAGNAKLTIEFIKFEFINEDYVLLTKEYLGAKQKLRYICPKGHRHSITWDNWQQGRRCPECTNRISKGEIEVRNFVESLGIKVFPNDRSQIFNPFTSYPLELDIFMPTLNKAIEYNGEYWHKNKDRDLLKQQLCKSKEINLLTIWDKEWLNESEKCRNRIKKFIFDNREGI